MKNSKFILNVDDFGMSTSVNKAVLEGYSYGMLKSASLIANGEAFDDAIYNIIPKCYDLGVGIHLNITSGYSLSNRLEFITDKSGKFCYSFAEILKKAYSKHNEEFLKEIETEFRLQIEKIKSKTEVTHIDSHNHIHSIPIIFEIVCKLAKEYGITQIRTHFEKFYLVPDIRKHLNKKILSNILKNFIFSLFTLLNEVTADKYKLKTNDYLIGIIYSTMTDALTVSYGLNNVKFNNITVEAIIHPRRYEEGLVDNYFSEFLITKNKKLKNKIEKIGFDITNYVKKD